MKLQTKIKLNETKINNKALKLKNRIYILMFLIYMYSRLNIIANRKQFCHPPAPPINCIIHESCV